MFNLFLINYYEIEKRENICKFIIKWINICVINIKKEDKGCFNIYGNKMIVKVKLILVNFFFIIIG